MNKSITGLLCIALAGCAFDAVEHAGHVEAGAQLGVTLRLSGGGTAEGSAAVCAGLPVGWTVQGASYTGTVSGSDVISGPAVPDPQAAIQFGTRPDLVWSCWTHVGDEAWGEASSGVVTMELGVPVHATGHHTLHWSLGTTGLTGELLSATATSTVRVDAPGHPLDAAADVASVVAGTAVVGTPTGFMAVGEPGVSTSTDGIDWSVAGDGMSDLAGASFGGDTLWAWTEDALSCWTPHEAWQPIDVAWSSAQVDAVASESGLLVVDGDTTALNQVGRAGVIARAVPDGAEPGGLAAAGAHVVWRLWNRALRQPELGYSVDAGATWATVPSPALPQAVGQHDRVGVSSSGDFLWANVASTSSGAHVSLWRGRASGSWQALGVWPVGELSPTTTPVACDERWVVGLPWGGWLAVDDSGVVSRHALARSAEDAEYLCSGDALAVLQDGQITGVASWVDAPDLSDLVLPVGVVGHDYGLTMVPPEWTVTADGLPQGIRAVDGELTGVPEVAGVYEVRVEAMDAWSRLDVAELTLYVDEAEVDGPDDPDTDDAQLEDGTDSVLQDVDTEQTDDVYGADDTASVDVEGATGCQSVSSPLFLAWPMFGALLGLRRRR